MFAISAAAAGTLTIEQFGRLQVYLISFNLAVLLLTFGILPLLLIPVTPFKYRDLVGMSKDALVTAFSTGNLFVVLTVLTDNCKKIFDKYDLKREKTDTYIDVLIPISFNFPNLGKLIMLLFVLFAVWFCGSSLNLGQYGTFVFSGLLSFFGGVDVALPFMLDLMRLPSDMYQLYVVTGVINGRSSTLLAAMNLLVFTMITMASLTGTMKIRKQKILMCALGSLALTVAVILGSRLYFNAVVKNEYEKDVVVANIQLLQNPAPYRLYREVSEKKVDPELQNLTPMDRINKTGTIRVGYVPNQIPFSYFNTVGELVGFDIDMAHKLAKDFEWNIEFIPIDFFKKNIPNLDAMLLTAEGGSAWTLLYPKYHTVVIKPQTHKIPLAYPIAGGDRVLADIINKWIYLAKDSPSFKRKYDYWIMGIGAEEKKPRWSVVRNVLGWGLDKEEKEQEKSTDESKE